MRVYIFLLCLFAALLPAAAKATRNVSSPSVDAGAQGIEARFGVEHDGREGRDRRFRALYLYEYGFTDWYSLRFNARMQKLHGEEHGLTSMEWEHKFQLFEEAQDGWNGGFKLVHALNRDEADTLDLNLMGEKRLGIFRHRANLIFGREVGEEAAPHLSLGASYQVTAALGEGFSAGAEWFGSFGTFNAMGGYAQQEHRLGPVLLYRAGDALSFEAGYLAGISHQASDGLFKFFIQAEF